MKSMTVAEVKTHFSEVLTAVQAGKEIAITYGKKKEIKALLVPNKPKGKRKLGVLEGKATFTIKKGFKVSEEEFIGL